MNMKSVSFSDNTVISYFETSPIIPIPSLPLEEDKEESSNDETNEVKEQVKDKVYTKYTKFCLFGLGKCKKGMRCIYAHTFKELNPITCKWNEECLRKEKCYFKHSNETKTEYVKRAFPEDIKRLNICLFEEKKKKKIKNNDEENKDKKVEEEEVNEEEYQKYKEEYLKLIKNFMAMYYDPIFEVRYWADIPDSDDDEPYPYF